MGSLVYFSTLLLILQSCLPTMANVQCYKCTIAPPSSFQNEVKRLCSEFDYSQRYIVDCPYSTVCMKKTYAVDLKTKVINGTVRDCALQTNVIQDLEDGKWQKKISIEEPYTEGCAEMKDNGQKSSKTQYCYCRGSLCNGGYSSQGNLYIYIIGTMLYYRYFK